MPTTVSTSSIFGKFTSIFKSKDPLKREIIQSASILDRMLRSLEFSRKNLETAIEEHKKKLKLQSGDDEMARIIDEEIRNIHGYISIINKTIYDLARVKYRLETLFYVEEPLKVLPEIIEELRAVEPVIEKINPQLINHIKSLEQKVASIMTLSSSYIPGYTAGFNTRVSDRTSQANMLSEQSMETQRVVLPDKKKEKTPPQMLDQRLVQSNAGLIQQNNNQLNAETKPAVTKPTRIHTENTNSVSNEIPVSKGNEQVKELVSSIHDVNVNPSTNTAVTNIPLNIVEQWILEELKITGGIIDLKLFETKYGVSRNVVLEALSSLESKNLIRIRRK
ncbi:MAG: hypothetical protein QXW93_05215 [Desulfurococcaceae archaeon]